MTQQATKTRSAATYYVQTTSAWQGTPWTTVHKTHDRAESERLAEALEIGEHHFGINNPGLRGVRYARFISRSALRREGAGYVLAAENDLINEFDNDDIHNLQWEAGRLLDIINEKDA